MKKSIFVIIIVLFLISFSFYSNYQTKNEQINELLLENIECLSSPEVSIPNCMGMGSVDCPTTKLKVYYYILNERI